MGIFVMSVVKRFGGEEWENTYGVQCSGVTPGTPGLTDADVETILGAASNPPTDAETDPASSPTLGEDSLVAAVLQFDRSLTGSLIEYVRLFLTDHVHDSDEFLNIPLGFSGLAAFGSDPQVYAPGNVGLVIDRAVSSVGQHIGRLWMRAALTDSDTTIEGFKLVGLEDAAATRANVLSVVAASHLDSWFQGGELEGACRLMVPRYRSQTFATVVERGDLYSATPWTGIGAVTARSRQVSKGKKKAA